MKKNVQLKVGDIVTVVGEVAGVLEHFLGEQGEVISVSATEIEVKFYSECTGWMFVRNNKNDEGVFKIDPKNLRLDKDWDIKNLVNRTFCEPYHEIRLPESEFSLTGRCMLSGCNGHSTHRAIINFRGTIFVFYVCGEHFEKLNGTRWFEASPPIDIKQYNTRIV